MYSLKRWARYFLIFVPILLYSQDIRWWVESPPSSDENTYVGIGHASTKNPNYALVAEKNALRSIALEINAQISGQTRRSVTSINDISEREFTDEFIVSTLGSFRGLEKKDDFIDTKKNRYYIYFEYSKSDHRQNIEDTKKRAINLVQEYESISKVDFVSRLQKLVHTYEALFQVYGEDIFTAVDKRSVNLQSFVPSELSKLIRQINLREVGKTLLKGVYQQALVTSLEFEAMVRISSSVEIKGKNIPFIFEFEAGSGDFSFQNVSSDEFGIVVNGVSQITSNIPKQIIAAYVDLKPLKKGVTDFYHLDKALDKLSIIKKINFSIDVSLVTNDRVSIWVKSSEGIPNNVIRSINDAFDISFKKFTQFELIDRQTAESILEKKGQNFLDVCDNSECRIILGKELGVDKFILVDVTYSIRSRNVSAVLRYADIARNISEEIRKYDAPVQNGDVEKTIFSNIDKWTKDFYGVLNPPVLNLYTNVNGVRVSFGGKFEFLPLIDYEIAPGNYEFVFEKDGYETKTRKEKLLPNAVCCEDLELKEKTRFKAFYKSFILPGSGQRYSADNQNPDIRRKGFIHSSIGFLTTAATVYLWYALSQSQTTYDNAQLAYSRSTTVSGIESTRKEAIIANQNLNKSYNTAIAISALMALFSTYSGADAAVKLPQY